MRTLEGFADTSGVEFKPIKRRIWSGRSHVYVPVSGPLHSGIDVVYASLLLEEIRLNTRRIMEAL